MKFHYSKEIILIIAKLKIKTKKMKKIKLILTKILICQTFKILFMLNPQKKIVMILNIAENMCKHGNKMIKVTLILKIKFKMNK